MNKDFHLAMFFREFPNEASCRAYIENIHWGDTPKCPYCKPSNQPVKIYRYANGKTLKCSRCEKQFQVTTGTVFENSNLSLQKWLLAFYLIGINKKGISSIQLAKMLGVTQKTAWYLAHKIRYIMLYNTFNKKLTGTIEVDETYYGGKKKGKRGRGSENKTPIFGMIQRNGRLIIVPVEDTKRKTIEPYILANVKHGSKIMSDEWWAYKKLYNYYEHKYVNHGKKEYVRGNVHVNSLEGAWSLLKRSFRGIYHRPSKQHLPKYCAEFQFKYNTRKDSERQKFDTIITKSKKKVGNKNVL